MGEPATSPHRAFPAGLAAGQVLDGKFRLEEVVGMGGMGVIIAAQHLQLHQRVAIKVLQRDELSGDGAVEARIRFLREAQAAARLSSDHAVRIHDMGTTQTGAPFMVMELLRGRDLARTLEQRGPLPIELAVDYVVQACDAVGEAHANGIVHRDLKPSNLFVQQRTDGREAIKVLDFGISKALDAPGKPAEYSLTSTRSVIGSPYYMSPEQVRNAKGVDTRTDIWALGAILYECLRGEPAFDADTLPGICAAIAADEPVPLNEVRQDVPDTLALVVLRCLEKDPGKRFQSVYELVEALLPFLPVGSKPPVRRVATTPVSAPSPSVSQELDATQLSRPSDGARTDVSNAPTLTLPGPAAEAPPPESRPASVVRTALLAIAGLALVGGLAFLLRAEPHAEPVRPAAPLAAKPAPATPTAVAFSLELHSTPSGARVSEGGRALGTTPLTLAIEPASVATTARSFVLELAGYQPHVVVQGPATADVRVSAVLEALPTAPEAAHAPGAAPEEPPQVRKPTGVRRAPRPTAAADAPAEPDIRLER